MAKQGASTVVPRLRFPEFRSAGSWRQELLGSICDMQAGKFIAASEISEESANGLYPCFGGNGLRGYTKTFNQSGRYSLIGRQGALCGNVSLVGGDFYATEHAVVTAPKSGVSTSWLFYKLSLLNLNRLATGQAQPGLSIDVLEKVSCNVPKDEGEQQKIADCLTSLDEVIAAQGRKVEALKAHKRGLMQQLFPRDGETRPRLRFPEFRDAPEWESRRLFDLFDDVLDFRGRTPKKLGMEWGGGDIISLSANNVKNGFIDYSAECYFASEELHSRWMADANLEMGDIVFTMEAPLGKALLVPDQRKYVLSQRVVAFKTKPQVVNAFLIQLIWSDGFQSAIGLLATGSTAKGVSQKSLQGLLVSLPEKGEQKRIADCLSSLDTQITAESNQLAALKTHKQGLMQQLFPAPEADAA